ncbi:MAG: hypothetical protein ACYC5G_00750 [Candidatus Doudnabacteria bacterium]
MAKAIPAQTSSRQTTETTPFDILKDIEHVKQDVKQVNYLMVGVVIFIVITFLLQMYTMSMDRIKDKDLYIKYDDLYQKYNDRSDTTESEFNTLKQNFNSLNTSVELLKAKNSYLK